MLLAQLCVICGEKFLCVKEWVLSQIIRAEKKRKLLSLAVLCSVTNSLLTVTVGRCDCGK